MTTSQGPARAFVHAEKLFAVGVVLAFAAFALIARVVMLHVGMKNFVLQLVWYRVEWVGIASIVLLALWLALMDLVQSRSDWTHLPVDAAWWKYVLLGFAVTPWVLLLYVLLGGALILLPVVAPAKVIYAYTLGPQANLASAVLAVPFVLLCVSLAFAVIYVAICAQGKGSLSLRGRELVRTGPVMTDVASLREVFFLSAATMLAGGADGFELSGWCRWLGLIQMLVGKLLEIIIVGIGLGLILSRAAQP